MNRAMAASRSARLFLSLIRSSGTTAKAIARRAIRTKPMMGAALTPFSSLLASVFVAHQRHDHAANGADLLIVQTRPQYHGAQVAHHGSLLGGGKEKPARVEFALQMLEQIHQFLAAGRHCDTGAGARGGRGIGALQPFITQQQHRLAQIERGHGGGGNGDQGIAQGDFVIFQSRPFAAEQDGRLQPRRLRQAAAAGLKTAILFGGERAGLENDEISLCDALITIPTAAMSSLNLGQAVLLLGYEWLKSADTTPATRLRPHLGVPAQRQELIDLFDHLEKELDAGGFFFPPAKKGAMVRNLRAMILRSGLNDQEVRTIRGMIVALVRNKYRGQK